MLLVFFTTTWQPICRTIFTFPLGLVIFFTMLAVKGNFCAIHFFLPPAGFFYMRKGGFLLHRPYLLVLWRLCMHPTCPLTALFSSSPFSSITSALSWDAQLATSAYLTDSCGCSSHRSAGLSSLPLIHPAYTLVGVLGSLLLDLLCGHAYSGLYDWWLRSDIHILFQVG
jgi:hypothetical protein